MRLIEFEIASFGGGFWCWWLKGMRRLRGWLPLGWRRTSLFTWWMSFTWSRCQRLTSPTSSPAPPTSLRFSALSSPMPIGADFVPWPTPPSLPSWSVLSLSQPHFFRCKFLAFLGVICEKSRRLGHPRTVDEFQVFEGTERQVDWIEFPIFKGLRIIFHFLWFDDLFPCFLWKFNFFFF